MDARKVTYEHYIIQGVVTDEASRGAKVYLSEGNYKLDRMDAYAREQRYARVLRACPEDPGLGEDVAAMLTEVKAATADWPVEWTAEQVNPVSKGRI